MLPVIEALDNKCRGFYLIMNQYRLGSYSNSRQESSCYISNHILKIVHLLFNADMQALDYVGLDHETARFTKKIYTYEGTE